MELVNNTINNQQEELETTFIKTGLWHIHDQFVVAQIDEINGILYLFVKRLYQDANKRN